MNLFNRLFMIVLLVALIAGIVAVLVLAWTIPNRSLEALRDAVQWLDDNDKDFEKTLVTVVGIGIASMAFVLLILQLMPRSATDVKVTDLKVGNAFLSTAAISQRVEEAVTQVPNVSDVKAYVKAKRKGVNLTLDLHVDPEANLATVTDDALDTAREVLANRLHIAMDEAPKVRLHYRELRMRRGAQAPAPATRTNVLPQPALPPATTRMEDDRVAGDDRVIDDETAVVSHEDDDDDATVEVIDDQTGEKREIPNPDATRRDDA